ncbi:MAG: anti-sigma F factor [Clostridia bacterium]|nr:anti-sigma F factor [Clostridia bacterium]
MKKRNEVKIVFPSRSVNEGFSRAAVAAFVAVCDPTVEELSDIKTAVSEAVTNAVVHAYPDREGSVTVTVTVYDTNVVKIRVRDKGVGIEDVQKAREALFTTAGDDRSGLGFTVMESFSDKLQVRSKPGKGTAVTITKRITGKRAG